MTQSTYIDLESMHNIDFQHIDPDILPDNRDVKIDITKPLMERALDYIAQAKNPYYNRCGNILVKIEHAETETTIEDCMEGYFRSLC